MVYILFFNPVFEIYCVSLVCGTWWSRSGMSRGLSSRMKLVATMTDRRHGVSPLRPLCFWTGLLSSLVSDQTPWLTQSLLSWKTDSTKLKTARPVRRWQEVLRVQRPGQREAATSSPFSFLLLLYPISWQHPGMKGLCLLSRPLRASCRCSCSLSPCLLLSFSILHKNVQAHIPYGGLNCVPPSPQIHIKLLTPSTSEYDYVEIGPLKRES